MKKVLTHLLACIMVVMLLLPPAFAGIGADGNLYLKDANDDQRIGLQDIIYQFQILSGMRHLKYVSEADDANAYGEIVMVVDSGTIKGVVTEDTGDAEVWIPVVDALITCMSDSGEKFTQKTARDGSFRFEGLHAGDHVLAISHPMYHASRIKVTVEPEMVATINVRLEKKEHVDGQVMGHIFTPEQNGQLRALHDANVSIFPVPENLPDHLITENLETDEAPFLQTRTDDTGEYHLEGIPEGRYFVMANKVNYQKVLSIVSVVAGSVSKRNMVLFPESSAETGSLMGKVVENAPHVSTGVWQTYYPVVGAEVKLGTISSDGTIVVIRKATTNAKGTFSFVEIPVGTYSLVVHHEKFHAYQQQIVIEPNSHQSLPVINPQNTAIELDASGDFTASDPAQSAYDLLQLIQNTGTGCFCIDPYMNWHQDTQFVQIVLERKTMPDKALLKGQVVTIEGNDNATAKRIPIAHATVVAAPYFPFPTLTASEDATNAMPSFAPLPEFKTQTNENGYYEFDNLSVGYPLDGEIVYIVKVIASGFVNVMDKVSLLPGEPVVHNFLLKPEGVVTTLGGYVYDASAKCEGNAAKCLAPIENADVALFPIIELDDAFPVNTGQHAQTGPEGKFFFHRLAAIEYQLIVRAENYEIYKDSITLKPGDNDPLTLFLKPLEQTLRVVGNVLTQIENCSDGDCMKPVPGAIVYAYPEFSENATQHFEKTFTDENGVFRFFNTPEGNYQIVINGRGFEKLEESIQLNPEGILELQYQLHPLAAQSYLKGHVFNGAVNCVGANCMMNIPRAEIALFPIYSDSEIATGDMFRTTTNERGFYMFDSIPPGQYKMTANADMFKPWEGLIDIPPGELVHDITLLPEYAISTLHGYVFNGNTTTGEMQPVPAATVVLESMRNAVWWPAMRTETDNQGHFAFKETPSGEYHLIIRADGYLPFETDIFLPAGELVEKKIFLESFVGEAILKGMVRDGSVRCEENAERCLVPIVGAQIRLYFVTEDGSMEIPNLETTSDENGLYQLDGIPSGEYVINVWAEGFQEFKDMIIIKNETAHDILLFPLKPLAYIKGQILDGLVDCDDTAADCVLPVPHAKIELISEMNNMQTFGVESDMHGFYEIHEIPSGRYTVNIFAEKYQDRSDHITVEEGENAFSFELIPATQCSDGTGCSKSEFCSKPLGECEGDGICRQRPEACTEQYEPVCGCDLQTYGNACSAASNGMNILYYGECQADPVFGAIKGTVWEANSPETTSATDELKPIGGADIYLRQIIPPQMSYPSREFVTQSNDDGTFGLDKLPAGPYIIIVRAYGYQAWKGEIEIVQDVTLEKDIFLMPYSAESVLEGIVSGIISDCDLTDADANGICTKPIAAIQVILTPIILAIDHAADPESDDMREQTTQTDESGHYKFSKLMAGEYHLRVEGSDWMTWEQPINIQPGSDKTMNVILKQLPEPTSLVGMVRNGAVDCDPSISDCIVGIPGAVVTLTPYNSTMQSTTKETDDSGSFRFENLQLIGYHLEIEASNFETHQMDIRLQPGENKLDIELQPITQCKDNSECGADAFCQKPDGACEDNVAGVCMPRPEICTMLYAPVCGCNNRNYYNGCVANSYGDNILHSGECDSTKE